MTLTLSNAPKEVATLYADAREMAIAKGQKKPAAERFALRQIQLGGWYRTDGGWKRVAPDVRDKVNIRWPQQQPDGTYLITDVDVFYPNAVKGVDWIFDAARIRRACENTNRSIAGGAQRPALVEGHQHVYVRALGIQADPMGYAINFRPHPSKAGWARADLVDVTAEAMQRMKDRKLPGLSAEIFRDAGGLNERFGRVSLLGGTLQSLSSLPVTEVYSVTDQLCFSVEGVFPSRGQGSFSVKEFTMDAIQQKRLAECYSALSAAFAAQAAGEEGADQKVKEAQDQMAAFEATMVPEPPADPTPTPAAGDLETSTIAYSVGEITLDDINRDPAGVLLAFQSELSGLLNKHQAMEQLQLATTKAAEKATALESFQAFCADLHSKGHVFDDAQALAMFDSTYGEKGQLEGLAAFLKATATKKDLGPADYRQIFSVEDVLASVPAKKPDAVSAAQASGSMAFSAEEAKVGDDVLDVIGMVEQM